MCSGSEAGSDLRLIDFVYHSTLGLRVIKKKKVTSERATAPPPEMAPPLPPPMRVCVTSHLKQVQGLGFRVQGLGVRVWRLGCWGFGCKFWGLGFWDYRGTSLIRKRPPPRTIKGR